MENREDRDELEGPGGQVADEVPGPDDGGGQKKGRKRGKALRVAGVVLGLSLALAGAYVAGKSYFLTHYLPGTHVASLDVSFLTEDDAVRELESMVANYKANVSNDVFELVISGQDIGLDLDAREVAGRAKAAQDADAWPLGLMGEKAFLADLRFDRAALDKLVGEATQAYNKTAKQPVAAALVLDSAHTSYSLRDEVDGTALDAERVSSKVAKAVGSGEQTVVLGEDELVPPTYRADSDAAKEALERANKVFDLRIDLMRAGKRAYTLGPDVLVPWLGASDKLTPDIDAKKLAAWAESEIWASLDYADDEKIYVLDADELANLVSQRVRVVSSEPIKVPYVEKPRFLPEGGGLAGTWDAQYGRYLEVDKARQVAVLYDEQGRVLWETPVTTGNESTGNGTPTGMFSVYDKKTDFVLIGQDEDFDGKPDYEHPVEFWMPFNGSVGLHDASWRATYGGTEYLEHGSGGCVNLPRDAAEALYGITHVGEAVLVHQ